MPSQELRSQVDEKSKKFLRAVQYYGGEATTTDIRQRTGLNHNEVSYRFNKLEDLDLINIGRAKVGAGNRNPPKVAKLTGKARAEIERGLLGDGSSEDEDEEDDASVEVSEEEFLSLQRDLSRLEERVNVLTQSGVSGGDGEGEVDDEVRERVERLEDRLDDVRSAVASRGGDDAPDATDVADAPAVQSLDQRVADLEEDFADFEEYVYEWNEAVETYLYAIRRVFEEKDDVSFDSYLELVGEEDEAGL